MVSQEAYERYNKWLFLALERYWKENYARLVDSSPEEKYKALVDLRNNLDRSAVMQRHMKSRYIPARKIYRKLYRLIFKSRYGKRYLNALEKGDEKMADYENKLISLVESYLYHADIDLGFLNDDLKNDAEPMVQRAIENLLQRKEVKALKPGARIAWSLILVVIMNLAVSNLAFAQDIPEPSENVQNIMNKQMEIIAMNTDNLGKHGVWSLTYDDLDVIDNPIADALVLPSGTKVYNYDNASRETKLAIDHFRDIKLPPIMIVSDDTSSIRGYFYHDEDSIMIRQTKGNMITEYQERMGLNIMANHDYYVTIHEIMHNLILKNRINHETLFRINSRIQELIIRMRGNLQLRITNQNPLIAHMARLEMNEREKFISALNKLTATKESLSGWSHDDTVENGNDLVTLALMNHLHPELIDDPPEHVKEFFEIMIEEILKDPIMKKLHR